MLAIDIQPTQQFQQAPQTQQATKTSTVNKVDYNQIKHECIVLGSFADKRIEKQGAAPITYMEAPVRYNFGTTVDECLIEGPILISNGGIWENKDASGKTSSSIKSKLGNDGEEPALRRCLDVVHGALAQQMVPHKGKLGLQDFPDNMIPNLLKKPYAPPKDKVTKQAKQGEAPEIYWKLFDQGFGVLREKTTFTGLDKKNYSWDMLKGVYLKYKPLFHIKTIYSGQGKSISIVLKSAIVIDVKNKSTMQYQTDSIDKYNAENPDDLKILQERIQKLILERKEATEVELASGNQYPTDLAPANVAKDPLATKPPVQQNSPTQQFQQPPQIQQYQQPPQIQQPPQQQAPQIQQYQQPPQIQPPQIQQPPQQFQQPPQQFQQPPQQFQAPQQFQQPPQVQQPQPNQLAQMHAFMQNQPTAQTLNLAPVPTIPGLVTSPQFNTLPVQGQTIQ
jgi:hypothetical protein